MTVIVGTNSYGSLAEADAYFADAMDNETWTAYGAARQEQGLVQATRLLEMQAWDGEKTDPSQELDFPRTGLTDIQGNSITSDESLEYAKQGEFEYALALLGNSSLQTATDATGTNIKKVEAGSAKVTYFRPSKGSKYPIPVFTIMAPFFLGNSANSAVMMVSGNGDSTSFSDCDSYGLIRGFE